MSSKYVKPDNMPYCCDSILPVYLLPVLIGPSVVGDSDLIHAPLPFCHPSGKLRFDAEASRFQAMLERISDLFRECLITGFHIGKIEAGKKIREESEEFIRQIMYCVEHPVWFASNETGAKYDIRSF